MTIAIDARLNAYRNGGIPQYTQQLINAWCGDETFPPLLVLQSRRQRGALTDSPRAQHATLYTPPHHRAEAFTLPIEIGLRRPSVVLFPDFIAPTVRTFSAVVTIHDLAFLHFDDLLDDAARAFYGRIRASSARADAIIAVSQSTKRDIVQFLDIDPARIHVISEAAAAFARPASQPDPQRTVNGTLLHTGTFLLFVSTIEPRKNLPLLLEAFRICRDRHPDRNYQLVAAGARGWRDAPIIAKIAELRLQDAVTLPGAVAEADLHWLYTNCRIYANPSRYEGFGLPLLEALACGAPALASDTSSLPEVGGTAAHYLPVDDAGAWADAIEALWVDDDARATMAAAGPIHAQQFSWHATAVQTRALLESVISQ
ncbi:MAG: glycosyltransferase family 1 protein [Chloroflexi bacterium]|nr:MAG: glycosyltransferase family 1 protein [Chloroflexota bacterium]